MTSTYVATVSPFGGAAPGDGPALARVRYVTDHATYVASVSQTRYPRSNFG